MKAYEMDVDYCRLYNMCMDMDLEVYWMEACQMEEKWH
jgi:hypothetical protein